MYNALILDLWSRFVVHAVTKEVNDNNYNNTKIKFFPFANVYQFLKPSELDVKHHYGPFGHCWAIAANGDTWDTSEKRVLVWHLAQIWQDKTVTALGSLKEKKYWGSLYVLAEFFPFCYMCYTRTGPCKKN